MILGIEGNRASWVIEESRIMEIAAKYFWDLFMASDAGDDSRIFTNVQRRITDDMNEDLLQPFKTEEVWHVIKSMAPLKASSIDDSLFYFIRNIGML